MNVALLRGIIRARGNTQAELAEFLGISLRSLNSKLNGKGQFTQSEIAQVRERYMLSDKMVGEIFFSENVNENPKKKQA